MAERLLQTDIKREDGYLYFVKKNEAGLLGIYRAKMQHGRKKSKGGK